MNWFSSTTCFRRIKIRSLGLVATSLLTHNISVFGSETDCHGMRVASEIRGCGCSEMSYNATERWLQQEANWTKCQLFPCGEGLSQIQHHSPSPLLVRHWLSWTCSPLFKTGKYCEQLECIWIYSCPICVFTYNGLHVMVFHLFVYLWSQEN